MSMRRPKPWLHFVGCFASRVTLYSQQVRALNLVHELLKCDDIPENKDVAIIGAGAAGITAATALTLARPDLTIDIFESEEKILALQRNCRGRYLRPHIYDWPESGTSKDTAKLPILDWKAGTARQVARTIEKEFRRLARPREGAMTKSAPGVYLWCSTTVKNVRDLGDHGFQIEFYDVRRSDPIQLNYRWVLACVGFGLEKCLGEPNQSYWGEPISGTATLKGQSGDPLIFISGNGDGGLIDFAMAALSEVDHCAIEDMVIQHDDIESIKTTLTEIEQDAKRRRKNPALDIFEEYKHRIHPPVDLIKSMVGLLRKKVRIVFHTREKHLFTLNSSVLNRFIFFLIERANAKEPRITLIKGKNIVGNPLAKVLKIESGPKYRPDKRILRFGPDRESARKPFTALPVIPTKEPLEIPKLSLAARRRFQRLAQSTKRTSGKHQRNSFADQLRTDFQRKNRDASTKEKTTKIGRWWIYGLAGARKTERFFSVGYFLENRQGGRIVDISNGIVHRFDPKTETVGILRGRWRSRSISASRKEMQILYRLSRPSSVTTTEPDLPPWHDSVMQLTRTPRAAEIGSERWTGWFDDLGGRRGVWGFILAEPLSQTIANSNEARGAMETQGHKLIKTLLSEM